MVMRLNVMKIIEFEEDEKYTRGGSESLIFSKIGFAMLATISIYIHGAKFKVFHTKKGVLRNCPRC